MQTPSGSEAPPRRRRDPLRVVRQLCEDLGPRAATSTGEAQAAAFVNAQLRLGGMSVATPAFPVLRGPGADDLVLLVGALVAVLLYRWVPFGGVGLVVLLLGVTAIRRWRGHPMLARQGTSQHVVGVLVPPKVTPPRRVVLLAPLDAPPRLGALRSLGPERRRSSLGLALLLLLLTLMLLSLAVADLAVQRLGWYAQWPVALGLLPGALAALLVMIRPVTPGATCHAAALATIAAAVAASQPDPRRELWAVAVGASERGGLADLLVRYPFAGETVVLAVEGLGVGELTLPERLGRVAVDPQLHALAQTEPIAARPCHEPTLAATLVRRGYRALLLTSLDAQGRWTHRARSSDTPDVVDVTLLERAQAVLTRLIDAEL